MRGCVGIQKEAGILERGMQALRSALSSLLGQSGDAKPEDKVGDPFFAPTRHPDRYTLPPERIEHTPLRQSCITLGDILSLID